MLKVYTIQLAGKLECFIEASNLRVAVDRSLKEYVKHPTFGFMIPRERFDDTDLPLHIDVVHVRSGGL